MSASRRGVALQQWPEADALHDARDGDPGVVEHGRAEVDVHTQARIHAAGLDFFRVTDDQWHLE